MTAATTRSSPGARSRARSLAVQGLYQWQVTGQSPGEIEHQLLEDSSERRVDREYLHELLEGVPGHLAEIDAALAPLLDRPLDQVDPVERAVLRLGVYELGYRPEVPWRVVINEAIDLAKRFGASQGHRYVNGILDRYARTARASETGRPSHRG